MRLQGERAFAGILAGQMVSSVGSAMTRFGLVIWTLAETGDTTAYSLLLLAAFLPLGLGALVAGPLVDRLDRRQVMIVANIASSLSTLAIALLYVFDGLATWHLYVALFVNGIANAFVLPAFDASVPLLVRKEQLGRAAGLSQMIAGLEMILGPPWRVSFWAPLDSAQSSSSTSSHSAPASPPCCWRSFRDRRANRTKSPRGASPRISPPAGAT